MDIHKTALAHFEKITPRRYQNMIAYFHTPKNIWEAKLEDLIQTQVEPDIIEEYITWRNKTNLEKILQRLEQENIKVVHLGEAEYPYFLSEIFDPPQTLFFKGTLPSVEEYTISIVGTRKYTAYGRQTTEYFADKLSQQSMTIVSGLALGIDTIAHTCAVKNNNKTIAVLGSGLSDEFIYPRCNLNLSKKIIETGGALVSEYPPDFKATLYSFPARNRIIAGLSRAVLITEAPVKSGALITGRSALDYNREVFVVPHPIFSVQGEGNNNFIKKGATPVTNPQEILDELGIKNKTPENKKVNLPITEIEGKILGILSKEAKHIDEIAKETNSNSSQINTSLAMLEIKNLIKNIGNMMFIKN